MDHPDESQVTPEHIVAPHRERTIERMRAHDTVLCIQDGTDLNFATRPGCEGLSIIGRNQTSAKTRGLHLHLTLAVSGAGLPLGVLRCGFDAPALGEATSEQDPEDGDDVPASPTDTKSDDDDSTRKTRRWLDGLHDVAQAASELPRKVRVLSVISCASRQGGMVSSPVATGRGQNRGLSATVSHATSPLRGPAA